MQVELCSELICRYTHDELAARKVMCISCSSFWFLLSVAEIKKVEMEISVLEIKSVNKHIA